MLSAPAARAAARGDDAGIRCCKGELQAVPLYRQDELLQLDRAGRHLARVKQDRCQSSPRISRAGLGDEAILPISSSGETCWRGGFAPARTPRSECSTWEAANQAGAGAGTTWPLLLEGILVQKDLVRAETLMREAASLGFLRAQMEWVEMLLQGHGGVRWITREAYHWLRRRHR